MKPRGRAAVLSLLLAGASAPAGAGDERAARLCGDIKTPFFVQSGSGPGGRVFSNARPRSLEASFMMPKPAGSARVFIVGEAAAVSLGGGEDAPLYSVLQSVFGGRPVELINCGMAGYDSRRMNSVFEEALAYDPDLILVLGGNNEAGKDFCPELEPVRRGEMRRKLAALARESLPREEAEIRADLALYGDRMRGMALAARARGVPVILCTLPANLRDYAPSGDRPADRPDLLKGMALMEKNESAAALKIFRSGLKEDPREPFFLYYAGRALDALGRTEEAAAYYADAAKYDAPSGRCSPARNAVLRTAAAGTGACLADLERLFSGFAKDGLTGSGQLSGGQYWFGRYGAAAANAVGEAAAACPALKERIGGTAAMRPAKDEPGGGDFNEIFFAALGLAAISCDSPPDERLIGLLSEMRKLDGSALERRLFQPPGSAGLEEELDGFAAPKELEEKLPSWRAGLLYNAAEMYRRAGQPGPAARCAEEAAKLRPDCPALNFIRWRLRLDADGAGGAREEMLKAASAPKLRAFIGSLGLALGFAPGLPPLPPPAEAEAAAPAGTPRPGGESKKLSDAAVALIGKGDLKGAVAMLESAVAADPENFDARISLCSLAAGSSEVRSGGEHCDEAVLLAAEPPRHAFFMKTGLPAAFYARGLFYLKTGDRAQACGDLKKAAAYGTRAAEAGAKAAEFCAGK